MRRIRGIPTATIVVLLMLAGALCWAPAASAASGDTYLWLGAGSDSNWSTPANWECTGSGCATGSTPISDPDSDVLFPEFPQGNVYATTLDQSVTVNTLKIYNSSYSVAGGTNSFTVDGSSVVEGSITASSETFSGAVALYGPTTLTATTVGFGSTVASSSTGTGPYDLTVDGGASFSEDVGDSIALDSLDVTGTATLPGAVSTTGTQTYGGAATLTANTTLSASKATFSSTLDGAYGVTTTGDAEFDGAVGSIAQLTTLQVGGATTIGAGSVSTSGSQGYGGALTLSAAATLTAMHVGVTGLLDAAGNDLTIDAPAELAGGATNLGSLTVDGTLTLSGGTFTAPGPGETFAVSGDLDATGATYTANGGTLTLDGSGAQNLTSAGNTLGSVTIDDGSSVTAEDALDLSGSLAVLSGGELDLDGSSASVAGFAYGGTITNSGSATTLTTAPVANSTDTFSGIVSGAIALQVNGAGTQNLSNAANSYTGGTDISAGTLGVSSDGALGDSSSALTFSGGTLQLQGSFVSSRAATLDAGGGTIDTDGNTSTLSGLISGSGGLTKAGSGTLTLQDALNPYTGGTTLSGGSLEVSSDGALGGSSDGLTFNGGTLLLGASFDSSRKVTVGAEGGMLDTNGKTSTFSGPRSGSGVLTKAGSGTLTLSGKSTSAGLTNVVAGVLEVTGSLAGPLAVQSGASATVTGTVGGHVTVNSGSLACREGTLKGGPVINHGGTLTGGPTAPTHVSAAAGAGQARVSFTPAPAKCFPTTYTVTALPGGRTVSGAKSPITVTGLHNGTTHTFTVRAVNPIATSAPSSPSNAVTIPVPPSISITSPELHGKYSHNQRVLARYSCHDGKGGSGLKSCKGPVADGQPINTKFKGRHTFKVTAISQDGLKTVERITYNVK